MDIRVGRIGQVYDDWRKMACLYKDEQERSTHRMLLMVSARR